MAMRELCSVISTLSSKRLIINDVFDGCLNFAPLQHLGKPSISAKWLWSSETVQMLSYRIQKKLDQFDERIPVLQIGTHVCPYNTNRKFYCVTDMTVKQAAPFEHFRVNQLGPEEVLNAISVQKKMFHSYEKVFALCEWTRTIIINDYGYPPENVITVGAGTNMPELEPAENKFGSHQILFVGYDWVNKGGPLLLEAFRIVKKKFADASLNIVGCRPKCRDYMQSIGQGDVTIRTDSVKAEEIWEIVSAWNSHRQTASRALYNAVKPLSQAQQSKASRLMETMM